MTTILFCCHKDPGFFVHGYNTYFRGVESGRQNASIKARNSVDLGDDEIDNLESFSLIIPILNESRAYVEDAFVDAFRGAIVKAVNERRCRLFFDFSNEAGTAKLVATLSEMLKQRGIENLSNSYLLCQNRLLREGDDDQINILHFDFFVVAGVEAAVRVLMEGASELLVEAVSSDRKKFPVLCLNATPRSHRILAILEMIDQGIISKADLADDETLKIPYVSLPELGDSKGAPLASGEIQRYLRAHKRDHLWDHFQWLQDALPLRVDSLKEKGNQLATKIISGHYYNSHMSIVNETGIDDTVQRITEKTIKALAMGHPLVVVGHVNSIRIARGMGFSLMDDFIDHSYDSTADPAQRIREAIGSAKQFLSQLSTMALSRRDLSAHSRHNIMWAMHGFKDFYYGHYVKPILACIEQQPACG